MFLSFIILVDRAVDVEVSLTFQISDIYPEYSLFRDSRSTIFQDRF